MLREDIRIKGVPLRGGAITERSKAVLKPGEFSMVQNLRGMHPGFEKRGGQIKKHTTADGTNQVVSIYQFKKTRPAEDHVYALMSDGDILEATDLPPTVTTGVFGSEFKSLTTSPKPPSWSNASDFLLFANGVDQHQIYPGDSSTVRKFVVYVGGTNPTTLTGVIEEGFDYSDQMSDGQSSTVAILNGLNTAANGQGFFICTPVPAKSLTVTVSAANGNTATLSGYYWKSNSTWASLSGLTDGTASGGATIAQTGTILFTEPTDIQDKFLFGTVGYWYLFVVSAALDAEVEVSSVTYNASMGEIKNIWNGAYVPAAEVLVEGTTQFETYGSTSVDLDSLASGKKIYIASTDPIEGIYIDAGETPNATGTALTSLKYWDGNSWESVGTVVDGTSGMANSGWLSFPRQANIQPLHFESSVHYSYWYELIWDSNIAADVVVGIYTQPYFTFSDFGYVGRVSAAWKNRGVYSFKDKFQEYVYISSYGNPQGLNGDDYTILEVGDGRAHEIVAMRPFFNDLMVWQEEKGAIGGTITIVQGYNVATFGKAVLSNRIGTFSSKTVDVIENFKTSTASGAPVVKAVAFALSREGVYMSDGRSITFVSDDIQNYFDRTEAECIRRGYDDQHWLKYDPTYNCISIGIVSGSSATTPNVFLNFDLTDLVWYFDSRAQEISCMENIDAGSGDTPYSQLAGGVDDGTVYIINTGDNDVDTAIDSFFQVEIPSGGEWWILRWLMLQMKAQTGNITVTTYQNGIQKDSFSLSQAAEISNQESRRHRKSINVKDPVISVKVQHNTASQDAEFQNIGLEVRTWENR